MKKIILTLVMLGLFIASTLIANPRLASQHKNMKKDGKALNCNYCHNDAKVPRQKGSYPKAKVDANRMCKGSGCHPR